MDKEDLPSDSDESDVDYAPSSDDNAPSEVESDGDVEEDPAVSGDEEGSSNLKRKRKQKLGRKKAKVKKDVKEKVEVEEESEEQKKLTAEEEKRKTDSLWSDFLSDTSSSKPINTSEKPDELAEKSTKTVPKVVKDKEDKVVITKVFEYAGEEVKITKEVSADSAEARLKPGPTTAGRGRGGGRGGLKGLSAVLGQLGKKEKIGTLEKSKLDWDRFKKAEGIEDEVQTHNRGRDGYLERQDFLQRADVRQFEIEKNMRTSRRSNR